MTSSPSRETLKRVRKLSEIAPALRQGKDFPITRLTTIKSLCREPQAASAFALFLARHAQEKVARGRCPQRDKELVAEAIPEMEAYVGNPSAERAERLRSLLREVEAQQNESKRISWNQVRMIRNRDLLVVEDALRVLVSGPEMAPTWAYQAARDYAERYDPRYGTGLIPSSAPLMEDIARFWRDHFGVGD